MEQTASLHRHACMSGSLTVQNQLTALTGMKQILNKSAKWHCGRHTLICKKNSN